MANYQQNQQSNTYGQYFGYGAGIQYDNSNSQNKWGTGSNSGNQTNLSQSQNQQQMYQTAAQNYGSSGYYGSTSDQVYGQQNFTTATGSLNSSMNVHGTRNTNSVTGNTSSTNTGHKPASFNSATTTSVTGATNMSSYTSGYGSTGGSFNSNMTENKSGMNTQNQMTGAVYGNSNQNTGMNSNMASNMNMNMPVAATSQNQTQSFGNSVTADTLSQFNQMSQLFGNGTNFGAYTSGDASGGNFTTGYNPALNPGMMTLLQQSLMQQANSGGASFGMGTGNSWGMSDGDGGFYAPPADSNYQSGSDFGGGKQGRKGKKWSGKDNKQDFYGNRFAQMFTGVPAVLGQSQTGTGKGKRLMDGVRFNVKGEKVIDVEIPVALYSRWGQLRKFFSKQDTEVAKHLIEFHDEMCEECFEREQPKKKKQDHPVSNAPADTGASEAEEVELSEEDQMLQQVMGFGKFNTTREAMVENNQVDSTTNACVSDSSAKSTTWETKAGFIGPQNPNDNPLKSQTEPEKEKAPALSEEEKRMMDKLGWSVFNKKDDEEGDKNDDVDDDDEEKMDDGGKE